MSRSNRWFFFLIVFALLLALIAALASGPVSINLSSALAEGWHSENSDAVILWQLRLPRALLAIMVGAALGMGGAAMQGMLRNPLAEPALLGVSSGAALAAILLLYYGVAWQSGWLLPLLAIAGAFCSVACVWMLAGRGASASRLVLAGVAINAFLSALMALALNYAPSMFAMQEIVFWLLGSLANRGWDQLLLALPFILAGAALLFAARNYLRALSLGEATAASLGFRGRRYPLLVLAGIAAAVGAAVAVAGTIGFVGLVVPHLMRPLVRQDPGRLLWASALAGALLLLIADILVINIVGAQELRIGAVTAFLGAPFFFWLIVSARRGQSL
ncbi:iron ABC transporter permease [Microbulbifer thermotolerans]|uniref:FecCD family ABC transporter permease n=1 Tax=Microbulbifer thermotolerans TaxID=252514 RepID=UPI0008E52411|nr:iron ABC transporter permease [Microbulbifer thermotolerans]MCX2780806.1 iron ABC transporter permease [Microbulbifer thermotolerans]MCX2784547.1 iron ABC transporter permease [Microbulbifer thermotolerans]MCX2794426.1 iron ABC transporter permease [Microbulbifer thermotolerans]MCX2804771.1 iron ABC transporter permease [Microbulbifer thermotolerans]MCX2841631.1 iron ABC transporter permease [Microbulbifer thermotolerans]